MVHLTTKFESNTLGNLYRHQYLLRNGLVRCDEGGLFHTSIKLFEYPIEDFDLIQVNVVTLGYDVIVLSDFVRSVGRRFSVIFQSLQCKIPDKSHCGFSLTMNKIHWACNIFFSVSYFGEQVVEVLTALMSG